MQIKKVIVQKERNMYIAEDGMEFNDEYSCRRHEKKISLNKLIEEAEKFRITELDEELPLSNDGTMDENNTYRWYKVDNETEFKAIEKAYRSTFTIPKKYPEIICVETIGHDAYMDDAYNYNMETCKEITKEFWKKLGIKVTFDTIED